MAILAGLVVLILALKYLPIRSTVLIEGVFNRKELDTAIFSGIRFVVYYFDYACRECWEKDRSFDSFEECHAAVPERGAIQLSSVEPLEGDSVKIVGYKNVFGWVRAYRILKTNFAEELAVKQHEREEQERRNCREALDRRAALQRNLSVENFRVVKKQEAISYAARVLNITEERVVANKYNTLPRSVLSVVKKLIIANNAMPTLEEIGEENQKVIRASVERLEGNLLLNSACYKTHDYFLEFAASGTLAYKYDLFHVQACDSCQNVLNKARADYQQVAGLKCLSDKDLEFVRKTGRADPLTISHLAFCDRCDIHYRICKEQHFNDPPGPECLTKDDLHKIHTDGQVPENKVAHLEKCERCKQQFEGHQHIYFDRVAPLPRMPRRRLKSLKSSDR